MDEKQLPKLSNYRWVILAIAALLDAISSYIQFQISALAVQIMPAAYFTSTISKFINGTNARCSFLKYSCRLSC